MKKIEILTYFLTILTLLVVSYAFIDQNLFYIQKLYSSFAFQHRQVTVLIYTLIALALTASYLKIINSFQQRPQSSAILLKLIFFTVPILLFAYPAMLSYDIFNYMATAKITYFYRENQYIIMPLEFI